LESNKDLYPIEYCEISALKQKFPRKYAILPILVMWKSGNDLDIHIDVPTHLLFFGITKTLVCMIQAWCDLRGSTNNFTTYVTGVMETFDGLILSWLVCVPYTGAKLGGWISENYLSLARLMSWFYAEISTVVRDFEFIEPLTPRKYWTMKQNLGWLKIRDFRGASPEINVPSWLTTSDQARHWWQC
jgi:hypothetical protein